MNFLKNIAEKAKSVTDSPTKSAANGENSHQEGFICPLCLESFDVPTALQNHFEQKHSEDNDINGPPSPRFGSLGLRPDDARAETPQSDEEKSLFSNQVKALEESKTLLANEVMSLRKQLTQRQPEAVPNERILERANELAAENVGLKAAIDETTGDKKAMEERIKVLEEQVKSRASRDDSALLRQELVNIQKTMDDSLRVKERELKSLKETYDELFYEKQQLVDSKEKQDKALIETQHELREVVDSNGHGSVANEELEIVDILKSEIVILKSEVEELKMSKEEGMNLLKMKTKHLQEITESIETREINNAQLSNEIISLKENNSEISHTLADREKEIRKRMEENRERKNDIEALQAEKNDLEELVQTVQQRSEEVHSENETFRADASEKANKIGEMQRMIDEKEKDVLRIKQALESKEADIQRYGQEKKDLLTKIEAGDGVNTAIEQLKAENENLLEKLEAEKKDSDHRGAQNSAMIESLNQQIGSQKIELVKEQGEKAQKTRELQEKDQTANDLQEKVTKMNEVVKQTTQKAEADISVGKTKMLEMEESLNSITGTLKGMSTEYEKLKTSSTKTKEALQKTDTELKERTSQLNSLEKTKSGLETTCASLKENLLQEKNAIEKLRSELKDTNEKSIAFEIKAKSLEDQNSLNTDNIKALKQAKTILQDEKLKLETSLEEKMVEIEESMHKVESKDARINQLTSGLTDTEVKVKEMQRVLDEASGKELSLLSDIEQKRKEICEIQEEKASVVIHLESQQSILQRLTDQKDAAEKDLRMSKSEIQSLDEKVCQLQSTIEKIGKTTKEEIGELKTARELLLSQVVDLKNEKENAASKVEEVESKHKQTIKILEEKCHESQLCITSLEMDLANEKGDRSSDIEAAQKSYFSLEGKFNSVNVQVESLASEVFNLTTMLAGLEGERDTALSRTLELEAAVGSATEERRGLMERCVSAEAETERTRGLTLELRRKLDDAQAALHELGRENQSIQVELAKQSGRKWKDDTDVVSCSGCAAGFSLTNRKHHCRNCGNIFCNDCSNKQANMAGYKKPQRVCEGCFREIGSK